jgi:hypothetical protein
MTVVSSAFMCGFRGFRMLGIQVESYSAERITMFQNKWVKVPVAGAVLTAGAMLSLTANASAATTAPAPHHPAATTHSTDDGKGNPVSAVQFFGRHLQTYHFGRTLAGFTVAATDPYNWAAYHLIPTQFEVASRAVSPAKAPVVAGDTWVDKTAPVSTGAGHGIPPHDGYPLRVPVDPTAGVTYLLKYAQSNEKNPANVASTVVPAAQETVRRAVTPVENTPPVVDDNWTDKRPATKPSAAILSPDQATIVEGISKNVVGKVTSGVLGATVGTDSDSGH